MNEFINVFPGPWYRHFPLSSTLLNGTNPIYGPTAKNLYSALSDPEIRHNKRKESLLQETRLSVSSVSHSYGPVT